MPKQQKPKSGPPKRPRKRHKDRFLSIEALNLVMNQYDWDKGDLAQLSGISQKTIERWFEGAGARESSVKVFNIFLKQHTEINVFPKISDLSVAAIQRSPPVIRTPPPELPFTCFRLGNFELPVMPIAGSPDSPFRIDEVHIRYTPRFLEDRNDFPRDLAMAMPFLIECGRQMLGADDLEDNVLPRLASIAQGHETARDQRGHLRLSFELTRYSTLLGTNFCVDIPALPSPTQSLVTLRERFFSPAQDCRDLAASVLANVPGVEVVVLCGKKKGQPPSHMLIRKRGQLVHGYRGFYQASASGYMCLEHSGSDGLPCPFVTATREARQEIGDRLKCRPRDFRLLGAALQWQMLHPAFYGWIETPLESSTLIADFRRDGYEGLISAIPFKPLAVLEHVAHHKWTGLSALSVFAVLLHFFPFETIQNAAQLQPVRSWDSFLEPSISIP